MIRAFTIFTLLFMTFSPPVVAEKMTDPVTGMEFVWVSKGCLNIEAGAGQVEVIKKMAVTKKSGAVIEHEALEKNALNGGAVHEVDPISTASESPRSEEHTSELQSPM